MKHDLFSFLILVSKFERRKGRHFYGWPRAALSLATPLEVTYCNVSRAPCSEHERLLWCTPRVGN